VGYRAAGRCAAGAPRTSTEQRFSLLNRGRNACSARKRVSSGGGHAHGPVHAHRKRFLAEQGYGYRIVDAHDLLGPRWPTARRDEKTDNPRAVPWGIANEPHSHRRL